MVPPTTVDEGAPTIDTERSAAGGLTTVTTVAVLLAGLGSGCSEETVAVEEITPESEQLTTTVMVAVPPGRINPRVVVTSPLDGEQLPWEELAETNTTLEGRI